MLSSLSYSISCSLWTDGRGHATYVLNTINRSFTLIEEEEEGKKENERAFHTNFQIEMKTGNIFIYYFIR